MNAAVALNDSNIRDDLKQGCSRLGLALDAAKIEQLLHYLALIEKWNRVYSITAIRDAGKMVSVHILDSLSIVPHVTRFQILDVGSGAGLPGIPLAIAKPELEVTLLDSNQKKTAFMQQAVAELGLHNTKVVCARIETWHTVEKFNYIVSRAFSDLAQFVAVSEHLLAPDGVIAAMKGIEPVEEISCLPEGFRVKKNIPLFVPGLDAKRHLILVERAS